MPFKQKLLSKVILLAGLLCCVPEAQAQGGLLSLARQPISYVASFAKQHPIVTVVGGCLALWAGYGASRYAAKKWTLWNLCHKAREGSFAFWYRTNHCAQVRNGENLEENLAIASSAFASDSSCDAAKASEIFDALFERGLGFNEAVAAAVSLFDADRATRAHGCRTLGGSKSSGALKLLSKVVNQGHGFNEAREVVKSALKVFDPSIYDDACALLQDLIGQDAFNRKNILEEVLDLASQDFQSPDLTNYDAQSKLLVRHTRGNALLRYLFKLNFRDEFKQTLCKTALACALQVLEHLENFTVEVQDKNGINKKGILVAPSLNSFDILYRLVLHDYPIDDTAVDLCLDIPSCCKDSDIVRSFASGVLDALVQKESGKAQCGKLLEQMSKKGPLSKNLQELMDHCLSAPGSSSSSSSASSSSSPSLSSSSLSSFSSSSSSSAGQP